MTRGVDTVLVAGRDATLWLAALGVQRAFARTGLRVQAIELPTLLSASDAYVAMPPLAGLHDLLGLKEDEALSACKGVYSFGQRFANWSRARPAFLHAYDTQGAGFNHVGFIHYWVKARSEGLAVALEDFSLGAAAAKQGRFVLPTKETQDFSRAAYGFHLDARAYVDFLKRRAIARGVEVVAGDIAEVAWKGGEIAAVILKDGRAFGADLFVDASGPQAMLASGAPEATFEPWDEWFPCDRMLAASAPLLEPLPAFSEIAAFRAGWVGMYPLRDRTAIVAVFDSSKVSDRDMLESMAVITGMRIEGEAIASSLTPGLRPRPWTGNCIAMGEAAACLDPLDAAPLHVTQVGLVHLVALFPTDVDWRLDAEAYNRAFASHMQNLRDFQMAHYKLNERFDEPLWDRVRDMQVPDSLAYKIRLFASRGRIALYDDETFQDENWTSAFIGHGLIPRDYDPLADAVPSEELIRRFQAMLKLIAAETGYMPSIDAQLELHSPQSTPSSF